MLLEKKRGSCFGTAYKQLAFSLLLSTIEITYGHSWTLLLSSFNPIKLVKQEDKKAGSIAEDSNNEFFRNYPRGKLEFLLCAWKNFCMSKEEGHPFKCLFPAAVPQLVPRRRGLLCFQEWNTGWNLTKTWCTKAATEVAKRVGNQTPSFNDDSVVRDLDAATQLWWIHLSWLANLWEVCYFLFFFLPVLGPTLSWWRWCSRPLRQNFAFKNRTGSGEETNFGISLNMKVWLLCWRLHWRRGGGRSGETSDHFKHTNLPSHPG